MSYVDAREIDATWEVVCRQERPATLESPGVRRLRVPMGWLYQVQSFTIGWYQPVFVYDPEVRIGPHALASIERAEFSRGYARALVLLREHLGVDLTPRVAEAIEQIARGSEAPA